MAMNDEHLTELILQGVALLTAAQGDEVFGTFEMDDLVAIFGTNPTDDDLIHALRASLVVGQVLMMMRQVEKGVTPEETLREIAERNSI